MTKLDQQLQGDRLHLNLQGDWSFAQAEEIRTVLVAVAPSGLHIAIDAQAVERLDVTAAWLIYRQTLVWRKQGKAVSFLHFPKEYLGYFEKLADVEIQQPEFRQRIVTSISRPVIQLGRRLFRLVSLWRSWVTFFGHSLEAFFTCLLAPHLFRVRSVLHHVFTTGVSAMPIVGLIACLISIVITYQGGGQLRDLGAEIYTVDMVVISVLRELGVLLTAIMVAGRSGSAFAAEIGLMKTNQEVDALRVMGSDPFLILVVPRLIALVIALPLLTILADIVALAAAALISSTILDISFVQFYTRVETNIEFRTFAAGVVKAPFFAVVIALVGCWQGMRVSGSSESLGRHTTQAVVDSIFLVLLLDAGFSVLFYQLGF